ncbi:hypothetical protein SAMN05192540_1437 [Maribacter dokdonensis]|uniref:Uncharacterized protein n=1 Tax=Maribacter dokdonensis TaxID=320912 RepID=A0A1H4LVJ5_9FLAO|nr:hypothetical protein SAMN05192540_1437 [Maribacter dokdonensis]
MKKDDNSLRGSIYSLPEKQIYLNINHLKEGIYVLKIIHNNKMIKKISFQKKD